MKETHKNTYNLALSVYVSPMMGELQGEPESISFLFEDGTVTVVEQRSTDPVMWRALLGLLAPVL